MKFRAIQLSLLLLSIGVISCSGDADVKSGEEKKSDSVATINANPEALIIKNYEKFSENPGVVGLYNVPEMLTLCIADSAKEADLAKSFARDYGILIKELEEMGITSDGAPGSIYYNNNPENFVFECVYPIAKLPKKTPKKSKVVVLEASPMIIYNYYGPYRDLYKAYGAIKTYIGENKLSQTGPLREFYINDPTVVTDSSKWLTRIMVPVAAPKK